MRQRAVSTQATIALATFAIVATVLLSSHAFHEAGINSIGTFRRHASSSGAFLQHCGRANGKFRSGCLYAITDDEAKHTMKNSVNGENKNRNATKLSANRSYAQAGEHQVKIPAPYQGNNDSVTLNSVGAPVSASAVAAATAEATSLILSIDPSTIEIVPMSELNDAANNNATLRHDDTLEFHTPKQRDSKSFKQTAPSPSSRLDQPAFVKMFRGSASYIANHRNTIVVYHIPGGLLSWDGFPELMDDIALTWLLGMKIVIVSGCRPQIDKRILDHHDGGAPTHIQQRHASVRVTDIDTLRVVKEEAGYVRFEVERQLARSLRIHGGMNSETMDGNVVSGNFYSAQPLGVVDGIDYMYTGFPRRVEVEKIRQVHASKDIVLLSNLGVSPSGEVFNVNSECLAASVAGSLGASKVIYFTIEGTAFRDRTKNKLVQNLRLSDAKNVLTHYQVKIHSKGFASIEGGKKHSRAVTETLLKLGWAMSALEKGVKRAHIVAPANGALLQELYTRDGSGTLISRDLYEGIRPADFNDVAGVYKLISPLIEAGALVDRPKNVLENDIRSYYVYTRDDLIVACAQLKRFEGGYAEIGCMVVSKDYRSQGRGDAMLGYMERLSLQCGCSTVFVLSTQTMEWFVERGFKESTVDMLPPSRKAVYNYERKSKIYMKKIDDDRDLDASELWWNR